MATTSASPPSSPAATLSDVIALVCSNQADFLDLGTILSLRLVSKQVQGAVNPFISKIQLCPADFNALKADPQLRQNIRVVKLVLSITSNVYIHKDDIITFYNSVELPNLEQMEIRNAYSGSLRALAQCTDWPKLKSLKIHHLSPLNDILSPSKRAFDGFKNVKWPLASLSIISPSEQPGKYQFTLATAMLPFFPHLKELELFDIQASHAKDIVAANLTHLERLTIMESYKWPSENILNTLLNGNFPKLESFTFSYISSIGENVAFASSAWIKGLKKLEILKNAAFNASEPVTMSTAAAVALFQALHKSESLEELKVELDGDSLTAFETLSLPMLKSLELLLFCSRDEEESDDEDGTAFHKEDTICFDKPMESLFKAHMPALRDLIITTGYEVVYEWRTAPEFDPNSAPLFPCLKTLTLQPGQNCQEIQISPEVAKFIGHAFVSNGLTGLHLVNTYCSIHTVEPTEFAFVFGETRQVFGDMFEFLLEGISAENPCKLEEVTLIVGNSALESLPEHIEEMKQLKKITFSTHHGGYDEEREDLYTEPDFKVQLNGQVKVGSRPEFNATLLDDGVTEFFEVYEHFEAVSIESLMGSDQGGDIVLEELQAAYPQATFKYVDEDEEH